MARRQCWTLSYQISLSGNGPSERLADKCLERQMPGRTNACTGICPPVGQMPRRTNAWRGQMPRWTNAWTCGFRHLSSWHLSRPNVGSGICPPGICPGQMWVQAFVLLAFVRNKCRSWHLSSWHLSEPIVGPGICPPGICPKQNMVQAFVLLAFVRNKCRSWHLSSWHLSETKYGSGICPPGICPNQ